jgi:hypothetical protein
MSEKRQEFLRPGLTSTGSTANPQCGLLGGFVTGILAGRHRAVKMNCEWHASKGSKWHDEGQILAILGNTSGPFSVKSLSNYSLVHHKPCDFKSCEFVV